MHKGVDWVMNQGVDRVVDQGILQLHDIIDYVLDDREARQLAILGTRRNQMTELVQVLTDLLTFLPDLRVTPVGPDPGCG